jgi:hypothetical protein
MLSISTIQSYSLYRLSCYRVFLILLRQFSYIEKRFIKLFIFILIPQLRMWYNLRLIDFFNTHINNLFIKIYSYNQYIIYQMTKYIFRIGKNKFDILNPC